MRTIEVSAPDGVATGARMAGDRGPALVFVHGVGSTGAIWDRQLDAFGGDYRCLAIELRGNGVPKPEPDPEAITREAYARDVLAVCDAAGVDRFALVGCSLGGVVAFELWKQASHRLTSMVILGSFAKYPEAHAYADGVNDAVRQAGSMTTFAHARAAKLGLPPERLHETLEQMSCKSVPSYLAATQATWTGDYLAVLPQIDVPVLVVCGDRDMIAPLALSQQIADGIDGAQLAIIEEAGHVSNADAPQAFNACVRAFFDRTPHA